jgi:cobalt-zinc-cadmium efflux system membrane fusion protein
MRPTRIIDCTRRLRSAWPAIPLAAMLLLAGCRSQENPGGMTSFSARATSSATPQLFTIPADQMSHVQLVTASPGTMTHTLRLTGTVAYNAFKTTPVITQVGGPVSKILVVPGDRVKMNQPMLEVSSPDYAQLLDGYLKASDSYRLADKLYRRAQDLYAHHAIAQQDLEQAESNRTQAQADLNAAEQGMRILGIRNPEDLAKAPSSAQIPVLAPMSSREWFPRARWCRPGRRRPLRSPT